MFGYVKLTKNADPDKYSYSGYGTGFNNCGYHSLPDGSLGKNIVIFGVDMSSYVHIDNKGKGILILGKTLTQGLNHTLTAETPYSINFTSPGIKFYLSLHYNGRNSSLFVNSTKIYQFQAKDSEIKKYPLCLGNISKDFTANNMKKIGLNGYAYEFFVDYNIIDTSNIIDIHKYLMKKYEIKCLELLKR